MVFELNASNTFKLLSPSISVYHVEIETLELPGEIACRAQRSRFESQEFAQVRCYRTQFECEDFEAPVYQRGSLRLQK